MEIKGKVNTAICYAKVVEDEAIEQIRRMCDYVITEGSKIRIMPDVHSGKGCTIGTTMTIVDKAVPNVVGVDIGCGILPELEQGFEVVLKPFRLIEVVHPIFDCSHFLEEALRSLGVVPEIWRRGLFLFYRKVGTLGIDVKDTSPTSPTAVSIL